MNTLEKIKKVHCLAASLALLFLQPWANSACAQTTTVLNFDVDHSGNPILPSGGYEVANSYFNSYGITVTPLTAGAEVGIASDIGVPYNIASSGNNFLKEGGPGGVESSVLLTFAQPLTSVSFTRIELTGPGNTFAWWSAEVYSGTSTTPIDSVSGGPYVEWYSGSVDPAVTYTFTGTDITSLEIDGNNYGVYGNGGIDLDDLTFTTAPDTGCTWWLLGGAAAGLGVFGRCRRHNQQLAG